MIYLISSILASSLIFIIFKLFAKYNIDTLQAIIVNYVIACISGFIAYKGSVTISSIPKQEWFWGAALLGFVFISVFNLMAITTQKNGLSVAAVATKMSLAIPIIFGIIAYQESTSLLKLIGIALALFSVYMVSSKSNNGQPITKKNLIFPLLVFIGSGVIDTSLKFLETHHVAKNAVPIFSATIFGFAAIIGIITLIYKKTTQSYTIKIRNIIAGIILGVPNYFSIYFLVKALRHQNIESSIVFTINNVAILLVSTIIGVLLFNEKLATKNWIGIIMAIVSIIMVTRSI